MDRNSLTNKIVNYLKSTSKPIKQNQISRFLEIKPGSPQHSALNDILQELSSHGITIKLPKGRYELANYDKLSMLKGNLKMMKDRGIVFTDDDEFPEVLIRRGDLLTALDGDEVLVQLFAIKKNRKPRGEVIKILKRNEKKIIGTIELEADFFYLIPEEENYFNDFLIPKNKLKGAKNGDKVAAVLSLWDDPYKLPQAEVTDIIGRSGDLSVEYESIIKEFDLPEAFHEKVINEAREFEEPSSEIPKERIDLTNEIIITIDPEDAKDFDDALSLKILDNGNYWLGVHIADVSHYVQENTELDIEARLRGNSVYLVDRVVPMLPEELSNNICSLRPGVNRNAFSIFMEISPRGALKSHHLQESVIHSKRRYTYDEVLEIINTGEGDYSELILELHKLTRMLRAKRFRSGGIEFETQEVKFILNENKYPERIKLKKPNDSTELVEECMLIANQTIAGIVKVFAKEHKTRNLPFLFRIHEEPEEPKIREAATFINSLGFSMAKKDVSSRDINQLLKQVADKPEKNTIHQILIRSMPKAIYSSSNIGHYGLGFKEYSHFTSPIRRYPDLLIHRLLKEYAKEKPEADRLNYLKYFVNDAAKQCNITERQAMEAERASIKLTQSIIAKENIGNDFNGTVTGVMGFGLFIELDGLHTEGLLHIRNLDDDYYHFDEKRFRLVGKRHKKIIGFGSRLRVQLIKVNMHKRQIDLAYIDDHPY